MVHGLVVKGRTDERGVISVVVIFMVVLFAFTAIVIDLGNTRQIKRQEQNAVDAAALAGVRELDVPAAPTPAQQEAARDEAAKYAAEGLFSGAPPAVTQVACPGGTPASTGCYTIGDSALRATTPYTMAGATAAPDRLLRVDVCRDVNNFFGDVVGVSTFRPCASAVAKVVAGLGTVARGIVVLDPSSASALLKEGNATITVVNGHVVVNSTNGSAAQCNSSNGGIFTPNGSSFVTGGRGGASCLHPNEVTGVPAITDPLTSVPNPSSAGLTPRTANGSTATTLQPGRYAGALNISGGSRTITMQSGIYWFDNGFSCAGANKALVSGAGGVLIFIAGGAFSTSGSCQALLSPMTSGPYAGITVFQARGNTTQSTIAGNGTGMSGTIYMPSARLRVAGNGTQSFNSAMLVVSRLNVAGNGSITLHAAEPILIAPTDSGIRLES